MVAARLAAAIVKPTFGAVTVGDFDSRLQPAQAKRLVGFVPQGGFGGSEREFGREIGFRADVWNVERAAMLREAGEILAALRRTPLSPATDAYARGIALALAPGVHLAVLELRARGRPRSACRTPPRVGHGRHRRRRGPHGAGCRLAGREHALNGTRATLAIVRREMDSPWLARLLRWPHRGLWAGHTVQSERRLRRSPDRGARGALVRRRRHAPRRRARRHVLRRAALRQAVGARARFGSAGRRLCLAPGRDARLGAARCARKRTGARRIRA
jgi:hypothetical protein